MGMFNDLQKLDQNDKQAAAAVRRKRPSFSAASTDELGPSPTTTESPWSQPEFHDVTHSRRHNVVPSKPHEGAQPDIHGAMQQRYDDSLIENIRKQVRSVGRESTTIRLTTNEKRRLEDIEYTLKRQDIDTSHNELCRIAIHHLLADYERDGRESVLARVLTVLNS